MYRYFLLASCLGFVIAMSLGWAEPVESRFELPRILYVLNPPDTGVRPKGTLGDRRYYIDRGVELSINKGNILNVYREKRLSPLVPPIRMFIGTMDITDAKPGSSVGKFIPSEAAMAHPMIRYKTAMVSDLVVPRLVIDSGVLFDPGDAALKEGVTAEFDKVARFIELFTPSKLIIEGHTDSDGEAEANQVLSEVRANRVVDYLIAEFDFISAGMVEARGYGEDQPLVPNNTPENKQLNRRIEMLIWE